MKDRTTAFFLALALLFAGTASAQGVDQILPPMGGPGGGQFFARCAPGDLLSGFELHTGDDVDAIQPVCVDIYSWTPMARLRFAAKSYGGTGGKTLGLWCPYEAPAVIGLEVGYEGESTVIINNIHLFCGKAQPNQQLTNYPTVVFDGPVIGQIRGTPFTGWDYVPLHHGLETCPPGLMAVGISGRSGLWLDAVGLMCGPMPANKNPPLKTPVKSIGRVNTGPAPQGPPRTICEAARDARARNSPAAPDLEAQCKAQGPIRSLGRVNTGPSADPNAGAPAPRSICDAARDALARNSPAAADLVRQCKASGGNVVGGPANADLEAVTARGEALAANDELAAMLRDRLPDAASRRGFFAGLGIWDGNTAPGPGKQRYHDALTTAEQRGFDVAAAYALPRNKYAALVQAGGAMAAADPEIAASRAALTEDGFYWLGFDIASGLFGDPAMGGEGARSMGAGPTAIRDSLAANIRRGFDVSAAQNLARNPE